PDSFKGTMTSLEICEQMRCAARALWPQVQTEEIPVADGGEGSVDAFLGAVEGSKEFARVQGPYGEEMEAFYGLCGSTAVVEMAAAAGLPLVGENRHAERTTTYGVGQLIACALEHPEVTRVVIGLGGSATNDGGCGAAAALGARFLDEAGNTFVPVGETLARIAHIDVSQMHPRLREVEVCAMCDIDNPLCGPQGASAVFGPQKGADPAMVRLLDEGLLHLAEVIRRDLGKDVLSLPGGGAAGGMGAGTAAFLHASLQKGIETVLAIARFEERARGADLILTGEGRIDGQSLRGKVVMGVAKKAVSLGVPVAAVVGDIAEGAEQAYEEGVAGIFTINRLAVPYTEARKTAKRDLFFTVQNVLHFMEKVCTKN
ncbi:MAG TPA: glycerate kinase, partial [Candidatus Caccousia stercoris]|nr:glycerate kinase [Candidatus Caccousia stercoris]